MNAEVWDRASAHYDRQLWLERSAIRHALDLLDPRADEHLLDVGTGTGEVLRQLARRTARPHAAIGIDISRAMLARVSQLPSGWSVRRGDARFLPFGSNAFDVAIASYVLHVVSPADLPAALAELRRVLRPDGRLVTVTPSIPPRGIGRAVARASDALARRDPDRYGGLRALDPRAALRQEGFRLVGARASLRGYPSLCVLAQSPRDG